MYDLILLTIFWSTLYLNILNVFNRSFRHLVGSLENRRCCDLCRSVGRSVVVVFCCAGRAPAARCHRDCCAAATGHRVITLLLTPRLRGGDVAI